MNTDIRISVEFLDHPKTKKLKRIAGPEAIESLLALWIWTAKNKPSGALEGLDEDDIELIARWEGGQGVFFEALKGLGWIEQNGIGFLVHDWQEHNPWASKAEERGNKARMSLLAKHNKAAYKKLKESGKKELTKTEWAEIANEERETPFG